MTLQQMKYVLTIAEEGSMNRAAERLFISQPSLTSSVRELEKEIGIQIFVRSSRGVSVTAEGADFLMYVRQVYQQYELLRQKYGESGGARRRFGVSTQHYSFAVKAFVEMVKNFGTLNFDFAIRETRTMDVLKDVGGFRSEGGDNLPVRLQPPHNREDSARSGAGVRSADRLPRVCLSLEKPSPGEREIHRP